MATGTIQSQCFECKKEIRTYKCEGCLQNFCRIDLTKHFQLLSQQLDQIENNYDEFRQKLIDQKNDLNNHLLIQDINKWENESINKIKQTADKCRQRLLNYTNKYLIELENQLNNLAKQIKQTREENEFNEIDLNQLKEKFIKLEKELQKPSNVSIKQQSTLFINKINVIVPLSKDDKWIQNGLTIAGGNSSGSRLNQLNRPFNIAIDDDHTIYIADSRNHRIVEWKSNTENPRIVAGGNGQGEQTNQLNRPTDVLIDKENNSLIIVDRGNRRIIQWSREYNTTNGEIIIEDIDCWGLTMDKDGFLYIPNYIKNEVRRWKRGDKNGTIVAGGNGKGDQLNQFNCPTFIFVDDNYSLYVLDRDNERVMKWTKDAKEGIIVAGGNGSGNSLKQLSDPEGVIVDHLGQIYVPDFDNHRVIRWSNGAKEGTIIVGGNGSGQESNQLNGPTGLSFDLEGNLYVVDYKNDRIQKFEVD